MSPGGLKTACDILVCSREKHEWKREARSGRDGEEQLGGALLAGFGVGAGLQEGQGTAP